MSRQVRLHPAAQQELEEVAAYYDLEAPGLGAAFLEDSERAGEQVRALPESSPIARGPARQKLMAQFPYAVVYSLIEASATDLRKRMRRNPASHKTPVNQMYTPVRVPATANHHEW